MPISSPPSSPVIFQTPHHRPALAISLDLAAAAAAYGVKRTISLVGLLSADNYTIDAVPTCAWSVAELAITLVCIAIHLCLPLLKQIVLSKRKSVLSPVTSRSSSVEKQAGPSGIFAVRTFGGTNMLGSNPKSWPCISQTRDGDESELSLRRSPSRDDRENGVQGINI
ncbi:hypothetical protein PG984_016673 [Apiospora sp. TS-2023a]